MTTDQLDDTSSTLLELADTLTSEYDLFQYLDFLLERAVDALGAAAGGVMLVNARGDLELLAATDERTRVIELYGLSAQQGPTIECFRAGEPVLEPSIAALDRWPVFAPAALDGGYHGTFAFPLRLRNHTIGALNLLRTKPGPVAPLEARVAQAFALMAAIGILNEREVTEARQLAGQLQTALNSRVVIEQAKGVIAERSRCEMGEAFQRLRWYARNNNLPLRAVAADIVAKSLPVEQLEPRQ